MQRLKIEVSSHIRVAVYVKSFPQIAQLSADEEISWREFICAYSRTYPRGFGRMDYVSHDDAPNPAHLACDTYYKV